MSHDIIALLGEGFLETVIMVLGSGLLGSIIGIPLGVLLHITDRGGLMPRLATNAVVGFIVNAVRSTPFIILWATTTFGLSVGLPAAPGW